jgi:hypothetical protein
LRMRLSDAWRSTLRRNIHSSRNGPHPTAFRASFF